MQRQTIRKRKKPAEQKTENIDELDRKDVLSALARTNAGLAEADLIPILTHYWFTGEEVMTYNDQLAVSVHMPTKFVGSAPGDVLYSVLSKADSETVTLGTNENYLQIKFDKGKSSVKLPSYGPKEFLFEIPEPIDDEDYWLKVKNDELIAAILVCMQSLGSHVSQPERRGITLTLHGKNRLYLYSTDGRTISRAEIEFEGNLPFSDDVILPESFCKQMLEYEVNEIDRLEINEEEGYALLVVGSEDECVKSRVFGRLMSDPNPPDFHRIFDLHLPDDIENDMMPFPKKLEAALERSLIIVAKAAEYKSILTVDRKREGNVMKIHTESNFGEVVDRFNVDKKVPKVRARIDLKAMALTQKTASDIFDQMYVDTEVVILAKAGRMFHMIANYA